MTLLTNSWEGGTNGTVLSTGNTGGLSGNAFDAVNASGTGTTGKFSNTQAAHGSLSMQLVYASGVASKAYVSWTTSMGAQSQIWFRLYVYLTAYPNAAMRLWSTDIGGVTLCSALYVNTAGTLSFNDTSAAAFTTTNAIPLNTWYRLEGFCIGSATVGQLELKMFAGDSATPVETGTSAATRNTGGTQDSYRFGSLQTVTNTPALTIYYDDIGLSSTGYLGPSGVAFVPGAARRIPARTPGLPPVRRYRPVIPPQLDAPFPVTESRQWRQARGMQPRRPHQFTVVPPQLNPPYPFAETAQRRETWARGLPRRGRQANVVPPQLNPPYPFTELRQQRQPRGFWPRRGHGFTPVPAQQAAMPNPAWVQQPPRRSRLLPPPRRAHPAWFAPPQDDLPRQRSAPRARPWQPRRGHVTQPPQAQAAVPAPAQAPSHQAPRRLLVPPRRGHVMQTPQAQAAAVAPAWVQSHRGPLRAIAFIRRRFRQLLPWPQAVAPPFTIGALTAADTSGAALTASAASAALTASMASFGTLTASDVAGSAGTAGLLGESGSPLTDEAGAFILLEDGS